MQKYILKIHANNDNLENVKCWLSSYFQTLLTYSLLYFKNTKDCIFWGLLANNYPYITLF
jgi:hypothetical protein